MLKGYLDPHLPNQTNVNIIAKNWRDNLVLLMNWGSRYSIWYVWYYFPLSKNKGFCEVHDGFLREEGASVLNEVPLTSGPSIKGCVAGLNSICFHCMWCYHPEWCVSWHCWLHQPPLKWASSTKQRRSKPCQRFKWKESETTCGIPVSQNGPKTGFGRSHANCTWPVWGECSFARFQRATLW